MANHKSKRDQEVVLETHPNPHGEQTVAEGPVKTDPRADENLSQNSNMNSSVAVQDPSTDSMFNLADPQTKELLKEESHQDLPLKQDRKRKRREAA